MATVEYVLQGLAAIVIVVGLLCSAVVLLLSEIGIVALFVAIFAVATAAGSGVALLAIDFLYPETMAVTGIAGLLWLVVPASLASVLLFDLGLEGLVLRLLRRRGMEASGIELLEAIAGGLVTALSLAVTARVLPEARLSAGAALAAGLTGAFVRYYIGLCLRDAGPRGEINQ